jgi:YfiH family protein
MNFDFTRKQVNGHFLNYYEDNHIILGFTEKDFRPEDLANHFNIYRLTELKQIHSEIIHLSSQIETMKVPEEEPKINGDGIILDAKKTMAVIKTADCTPLFFRDTHYTTGGVVHIGWQGLLKGIEEEMIRLLEKRSVSPQDLHIFLGPAIESDCYEVGQDLYDKFEKKEYRDKIFNGCPGWNITFPGKTGDTRTQN